MRPYPGRRVVPVEEMVQKIQVAADARRHDDTVIVARTDARTTLGIDEALRRGEAYAKAGADVLFIESPETEAELALIGRSFDVPVLCNVVNTGRTPELPSKQLEELGFRIAIYPGMALKAAAQAVTAAYSYLHGQGTTLGTNVALMDSKELHELMGFPKCGSSRSAGTPAPVLPSRKEADHVHVPAPDHHRQDLGFPRHHRAERRDPALCRPPPAA